MDLLLTHGYFLAEDPKEREIMKPYAPLGLLYLSSHLRARGFYTTIDQPMLGAFDYPEPPIHLSETPLRIRGHAPMLGEANAYVFGELLGLPADEIARLTEEGVLS